MGLLSRIPRAQNKEKVNNLVLFDKGTYDKLLAEVPKYKVITPVRVPCRPHDVNIIQAEGMWHAKGTSIHGNGALQASQ